MNKIAALSIASVVFLSACQSTEVAAVNPSVEVSSLDVALLGGWDGVTVPAGQQCSLHGGSGSTPPMQVSGIPDGTAEIVVQYNDRDYAPLARNGGHGTIAFPVTGSTATLPSVPGMTSELGGAARLVSAARSTGQYASSGYLPPCSGGRGNVYEAVVTAVSADNTLLATQTVRIGRY